MNEVDEEGGNVCEFAESFLSLQKVLRVGGEFAKFQRVFGSFSSSGKFRIVWNM